MRPAILNPMFADVTVLPGVGPKVAALIARAAGPRVVDVLFAAPTGLIDRRNRPKLADVTPGTLVTVEVTVDKHTPPPSRRLPWRVLCSDETGYITLVFFHARADYLAKILPEGARRIVSGKAEAFSGGLQIAHPDYVVDPETDDLPLIEPVYPLTAGLAPKTMRKTAAAAAERAPDLPDWLRDDVKARYPWPSWREAVQALHAPESNDDLSPLAGPRMRLAYDELLANQLAIGLIRARRTARPGRPVEGDGTLRAQAKKLLPFALTGAQERALADIFADMTGAHRMVRLLQGDVGSGKTVVALLAMLACVEAGAQAALMAPTEILARQHIETMRPICDALDISIEIFTGRDKGPARNAKRAALADGRLNLVVGTHALFQESVDFHDLALVVVDEQHRFGVHQRLALAEKGARADMLVMTATPIPRTLALTAYGDMDHSLLTEKPPGRKPVETRAMPIDRMADVVAALQRATARGDQAYWVCPLVEDSDLIDLASAQDRFGHLREVFGDRVGLVHGKMAPAEKDAVMEAFQRGEISVLVATTVIEVGVNAPNATVMVIEHAERFGLAQLHQLRGRVGRGDKAASCLLLYKPPLGTTSKARLNVLRETEDGFRIAEEDLKLRGAGDVLGAAQSGFPRFRVADLAVHGDLLAMARDDANLVVEQDPQLETGRGKALRALLYLFGRDDAVKLLRSG